MWSIILSSVAHAHTLQLQWTPQSQFAGFYMAAEKGFYKQAGIDIKIGVGGPEKASLNELISCRSDFATSWLLSGLQSNANDRKIVLIGQFFQKPALMLVAKKSSGIDSVDKFRGHTLGIWDREFQVPPKALIRKYKILDIRVIEQGFDMDLFLNGSIDIASAMKYNEYYQLLEAGIKEEDLIIFDYAQLGMNVPEDGIYVREDFFHNHPDLCKNFILASMKGWKYAFNHKNETVKIVTKAANASNFKSSTAKQQWMLDVVQQLISLDSVLLKKEDFDTAVDMLKGSRLIDKAPSYDQFFKDVLTK